MASNREALYTYDLSSRSSYRKPNRSSYEQNRGGFRKNRGKQDSLNSMGEIPKRAFNVPPPVMMGQQRKTFNYSDSASTYSDIYKSSKNLKTSLSNKNIPESSTKTSSEVNTTRTSWAVPTSVNDNLTYANDLHEFPSLENENTPSSGINKQKIKEIPANIVMKKPDDIINADDKPQSINKLNDEGKIGCKETARNLLLTPAVINTIQKSLIELSPSQEDIQPIILDFFEKYFPKYIQVLKNEPINKYEPLNCVGDNSKNIQPILPKASTIHESLQNNTSTKLVYENPIKYSPYVKSDQTHFEPVTIKQRPIEMIDIPSLTLSKPPIPISEQDTNIQISSGENNAASKLNTNLKSNATIQVIDIPIVEAKNIAKKYDDSYKIHSLNEFGELKVSSKLQVDKDMTPSADKIITDTNHFNTSSSHHTNYHKSGNKTLVSKYLTNSSKLRNKTSPPSSSSSFYHRILYHEKSSPKEDEPKYNASKVTYEETALQKPIESSSSNFSSKSNTVISKQQVVVTDNPMMSKTEKIASTTYPSNNVHLPVASPPISTSSTPAPSVIVKPKPKIIVTDRIPENKAKK